MSFKLGEVKYLGSTLDKTLTYKSPIKPLMFSGRTMFHSLDIHCNVKTDMYFSLVVQMSDKVMLN